MNGQLFLNKIIDKIQNIQNYTRSKITANSQKYIQIFVKISFQIHNSEL